MLKARDNNAYAWSRIIPFCIKKYRDDFRRQLESTLFIIAEKSELIIKIKIEKFPRQEDHPSEELLGQKYSLYYGDGGKQRSIFF